MESHAIWKAIETFRLKVRHTNGSTKRRNVMADDFEIKAKMLWKFSLQDIAAKSRHHYSSSVDREIG